MIIYDDRGSGGWGREVSVSWQGIDLALSGDLVMMEFSDAESLLDIWKELWDRGLKEPITRKCKRQGAVKTSDYSARDPVSERLRCLAKRRWPSNLEPDVWNKTRVDAWIGSRCAEAPGDAGVSCGLRYSDGRRIRGGAQGEDAGQTAEYLDVSAASFTSLLRCNQRAVGMTRTGSWLWIRWILLLNRSGSSIMSHCYLGLNHTFNILTLIDKCQWLTKVKMRIKVLIFYC